MADRIVITEAMRSRIGRDFPAWIHEVTTTGVRAYARGVGYTDPVYYDEAAARAAGYRSLPAPPTYLGTPIFLPDRSSDVSSRPLAAEPSIEHGLSNQLDGGTDTEYYAQICAGDLLSAVSRITDLELRASKSLGQMLVMTSETTFSRVDTGVCVAAQRRRWIYY